ncbi:MAG: hypothetical protein ACTSPQ_14890 [Candidatus Helarchaeota archaeon]
MSIKDWQSLTNPKILLIGHDPRLQKSNTIADYALFANFYFDKINKSPQDKSKYNFAKSAFDMLSYLTNNQYSPEEIYITNLYNDVLEHAPKGRTVLIPPEKIPTEIERLKKIIDNNPTIKYIFPMSLQVNYWLQKYKFYEQNTEFLDQTKPSSNGIKNEPPYFQPKKTGTFKLICGKRYKYNYGKQIVIPILHAKNYPLKGRFLQSYGNCYKNIVNYFKKKASYK